MKFVNLTPHAINLNNGTVIEPSGTVARVSSTHTEFDANGICRVVYGELTGLPEPEAGTCYIVSLVVANAVRDLKRSDVVSPATNHPETTREKGLVVSVPGFVAAV